MRKSTVWFCIANTFAGFSRQYGQGNGNSAQWSVFDCSLFTYYTSLCKYFICKCTCPAEIGSPFLLSRSRLTVISLVSGPRSEVLANDTLSIVTVCSDYTLPKEFIPIFIARHYCDFQLRDLPSDCEFEQFIPDRVLISLDRFWSKYLIAKREDAIRCGVGEHQGGKKLPGFKYSDNQNSWWNLSKSD